MLSELLEVAMLLAFGFAWPASIMKSVRARTARGKSIAFLLIVAFGYCCGIGAKFASGKVNYVMIFYLINLLAVGIDTSLYFRNRNLDRLALAACPTPENAAPDEKR